MSFGWVGQCQPFRASRHKQDLPPPRLQPQSFCVLPLAWLWWVQLAAKPAKDRRGPQKKVDQAAARLQKYEQRLAEAAAKKVGGTLGLQHWGQTHRSVVVLCDFPGLLLE